MCKRGHNKFSKPFSYQFDVRVSSVTHVLILANPWVTVNLEFGGTYGIRTHEVSSVTGRCHKPLDQRPKLLLLNWQDRFRITDELSDVAVTGDVIERVQPWSNDSVLQHPSLGHHCVNDVVSAVSAGVEV